MQTKHSEQIRLLRARAHAANNNLEDALKLLDDHDTIDSLKLAADLLIHEKLWDQARERLFQLIVRLNDESHNDIKADILMWLGKINILSDRIYDNQALAFINKEFIAKQPEEWQKSFSLLTNDRQMQTMDRESVDKILRDQGIKNFYELYIKR